MQDQPAHTELLRAAIAFIRDTAIPNLDGQTAFQARVTANVLHIVLRELQSGPAADAGELHRLRALLNDDASLDELNTRLCDRIASGDMSSETPGLKEHLWMLTMDKLAIDQPSYATYRRQLKDRPPVP